MPVVVKKQNLVVEINYAVPVYTEIICTNKERYLWYNMYIEIQQNYITARIRHISWQPIFVV